MIETLPTTCECGGVMSYEVSSGRVFGYCLSCAPTETVEQECDHDWEFIGGIANSEGLNGVCRKCGARHHDRETVEHGDLPTDVVQVARAFEMLRNCGHAGMAANAEVSFARILARVEGETVEHGEEIRVWRFHDAPERLQALSRHGGDEDWIALIPASYGDDPYVPWCEDGMSPSFGCCEISEHKLPDGSTVRIGAHA